MVLTANKGVINKCVTERIESIIDNPMCEISINDVFKNELVAPIHIEKMRKCLKTLDTKSQKVYYHHIKRIDPQITSRLFGLSMEQITSVFDNVHSQVCSMYAHVSKNFRSANNIEALKFYDDLKGNCSDSDLVYKYQEEISVIKTCRFLAELGRMQ